jgi:hypothetical protein
MAELRFGKLLKRFTTVVRVLPALTSQRVPRATQLADDLCLDLQTVEVTADTEGVGDLYRAVDDLRRRLDLLFRRET